MLLRKFPEQLFCGALAQYLLTITLVNPESKFAWVSTHKTSG